MKWLFDSNPTAMLRRRTHPQAKKPNEIRWSLSYDMHQRYIGLELHLVHNDIDRPNKMCLNTDELNDAKDLCNKLEELNWVPIKHRDCSIIIADACTVSDLALFSHQYINDRLSENVRIVDNLSLETGIVKVQNKKRIRPLCNRN